MAILNTVTYTLPTTVASPGGTDVIGATTVAAKGSFTVEYTYSNAGVYTSARLLDATNIQTSGGTGANAVYNNTFTDESTFDIFGQNYTGGDHTGGTVSLDPSTGRVTLTLQAMQTGTTNATVPSGSNTSTATTAGLDKDYNQFSLTFEDPRVTSSVDQNFYSGGVAQTINIGSLTDWYFSKDDVVTRSKSGLNYSNSTVSETINTSISDTSTGSDDTLSAVCYCKGTMIMTSVGEIAVEELAVGVEVMTTTGDLEPVIWMGRNTIDCDRQLHKDKAYPVRILKDAFGLNMPKRDLYVSPDHSLYVDGVMIPAYCLINGVTIKQDRAEKLVTYYHVELPQHHAILAEGLPAESYLETSEENRHFFKEATASTTSNVTKLDAQYPVCPEDTPAWKHIWDTQGFAPLTQSGPILDAVRARLALRAQELLSTQERQAA